jgi:hypothetical protein
MHSVGLGKRRLKSLWVRVIISREILGISLVVVSRRISSLFPSDATLFFDLGIRSIGRGVLFQILTGTEKGGEQAVLDQQPFSPHMRMVLKHNGLDTTWTINIYGPF